MKSTGVTSNSDGGSIQVSRYAQTVWQLAGVHNTRSLKLKQLNGIQPLLILSVTRVPFLHNQINV